MTLLTLLRNGLYLILLFSQYSLVFSQKINQKRAIEMAWENNLNIRIAALETKTQQLLVGTAKEKPKTEFGAAFGNIYIPTSYEYLVSISQSFNHPKYYKTLSRLFSEQADLVEKNEPIKKNEIAYQVKQIFAELCYFDAFKKILIEQDSIYSKAKKWAIIQDEGNKSDRIEIVTVESEILENKIKQQITALDEQNLKDKLRFLISPTKSDSLNFEIDTTSLKKFSAENLSIEKNPLILIYNQQKNVLKHEVLHEKAKFLPQYYLGAYNQSMERIYKPFVVSGGISIALSKKPLKSKLESMAVSEMVIDENQKLLETDLKNQLKILVNNLNKYQILHQYYEKEALPKDREVFSMVEKKYKHGQAVYYEYFVLMQKAWENHEKYLQNLLSLKQTINEIEFLTAKDLSAE